VAQTPLARVLAVLVSLALHALDNVIAMEVNATMEQKETESALHARLTTMVLRAVNRVIAIKESATVDQKEMEHALVTLLARGEAVLVGSQQWVFSLLVWLLLFQLSVITFGVRGKNITTPLSKT